MRDGHLLQLGSPEDLTDRPANDYVRQLVRGEADGLEADVPAAGSEGAA
jgi:ABC-type proline/glycine betaine transport system ATPase subunit